MQPIHLLSVLHISKEFMYRLSLILLFCLALNGCFMINNGENDIIHTVKQDVLEGNIEISDLHYEPYNQWYFEQYNQYNIDSGLVHNFKNSGINECQILIVMATWCPDSRREVPRFYRIMDEIHVPEKQISLVGVDYEKKTSALNISELNVKFVPTFIFYKDGIEIGRIIEEPKISLEKDMMAFLKCIEK